MKQKNLQGIGQSQQAHLLPFTKKSQYKQKYSQSKPQLTEMFLHGIIKQRMSGILMQKTKKLMLKYPKHKVCTFNRSQKNSVENKIKGILKQDNEYNKQKKDNQQIKQKTRYRHKTEVYITDKLLNTEILNPKKDNKSHQSISSISINLKKQNYAHLQKLRKKSSLCSIQQPIYKARNKNQQVQLIRYNTDTKNYSNQIKLSRKKSISLKSVTQNDHHHQQNTSKISYTNKSLLQSFLNKINKSQIHPQIYSILFQIKTKPKQSIAKKSPKRVVSPLSKIGQKKLQSIKKQRLDKKQLKIINNKTPHKDKKTSYKIFDQYLNSIPDLLSKLVRKCFKFFQIQFKNSITDKQYVKLLQKISNYHERGWSCFSYMIWDHDCDGTISQSDLFAYFNEIQLSNNTLDQDTNYLENSKSQYIQEQKQLLKNIVYEINQDINQQQLKDQCLYDQNKYYLQEAILHDFNDPTYSHVQPLIKASLFSSKKNKPISKGQTDSVYLKSQKQVLELFQKQNYGKKLSAYQSCHIAVQHNQQTREIRDLIEYARQKIEMKNKDLQKEQKIKNRNQMLIGKNGGFMNYRSYVGKDYGGKIKRIILNVLGYVSD